MTKMDYEQNSFHVKHFLQSKYFNRLTDNQQKYASQIVSDFNDAMQSQDRDDTHWTPASVKKALVGEYAEDPDHQERNLKVATVPVLKAYLKFLAPKNADKIADNLDKNREIFQYAGPGSVIHQAQIFNQLEDRIQSEKSSLKRPLDDFKSSKEWQKVNSRNTNTVINKFLSVMVAQGGIYPVNWKFDDVIEMIEEGIVLARGFSKKNILSIYPALSAFFNYLENHQLGHPAMTPEYLDAVVRNRDKYELLSTKPLPERQSFIAKEFIRTEYGIDTTDNNAIQNWMADQVHFIELVSHMIEIQHAEDELGDGDEIELYLGTFFADIGLGEEELSETFENTTNPNLEELVADALRVPRMQIIKIEQDKKITILTDLVVGMNNEDPDVWMEDDFEGIINDSLFLDPSLTKSDIRAIPDVVQEFVTHLFNHSELDPETYEQFQEIIEEAQVRLNELAGSPLVERRSMVAFEFIVGNMGAFNGNPDELSDWLMKDNNYGDAVSFMMDMQPWLSETVDDAIQDPQNFREVQTLLFGDLLEPDGEEAPDLSTIEYDSADLEEFERKLETERQRVNKLIEEFSHSDRFAVLTKAQQKDAKNVAGSVSDWMLERHEEPIGKWTKESLDDVLTFYIPYKTLENESFMRHVVPDITKFMEFLEDKKLLNNPLVMYDTAYNAKEIIKMNYKDFRDSLY